MLTWPNKDPDEVLDYQIDWSERLGVDNIVTSLWIIPTGITKDSETFALKNTYIWLSAGVLGSLYTLTNRVTTSGGRTMDQSVRLRIAEK